jgi:endonuclease YncB( thermonuclease family)
MRTYLIAGLLALLLTLQPCFAHAGKVYGKVVGVSDGDTITLLTSMKKEITIRLAEIDAPEKSQPYGEASKRFLSMLVFGKEVTAHIEGVDKYNRAIGRIYLGQTNVNLELVKGGMAWAYRQYLKDKALLDAEEVARANGLGLWGLQEDQRIPPWEWRQGSKVSPSRAMPEQASEGFSCAGKQYCREMASCAEANFYLLQCGLSRLDGDNDGVPCEKHCK